MDNDSSRIDVMLDLEHYDCSMVHNLRIDGVEDLENASHAT